MTSGGNDSPLPLGAHRSQGEGTSLRLSLLLLSLSAISCTGPQRALAPEGPAASELAWLTWALLLGVGIPTLVVLTLWAFGLRRGLRRARAEERVPEPTSEPAGREPSEDRLLAVGAIAVLGVLVVLLGLSVRTGNSVLAQPAVTEVEIEVIAHQFWWEVRYPGHQVVTANELVIPVGERVQLSLATADVIHSFWVPQLHGKRDMTPGQTRPFWLQADRPGRYRGQCAEFCGMQHALMAFWVRAVPRADYEAWLAAQRQPATPLAREDETHAAGRAAFTTGGCHLCHAVRGLHPPTAASSPGPDLTHFASRSHFAAATAEVTEENLRSWILDPHVLKPGARMPPTAVPDEALDALVEWLLALE